MTRIRPVIVPAAIRSCQHALRALRKAREGATALEFAIVSVPLVTLVIGIMSFAYAYYLQFALDFSLQQAVRQVQIGNVPGGTSADTFTGKVMCPIFVQFAPCTGLLVSMQPVTDYWTDFATVSTTTQPTIFCTGSVGTLMFARATYQAPVWASFMVYAIPPSPFSTGQNIVAAAAFANENPSGALAVTPSGC